MDVFVHRSVERIADEIRAGATSRTDARVLSHIAGLHPAIVILAFQLDNMTGVALLHDLQSDPATRMIPVVFFTGSNDKLRLLLSDFATHGAYLVR